MNAAIAISMSRTATSKNLLESAVDHLPESYRSVLMLRDVEGMDTRETAECLGISEEAVKVRLHRARGLMRKQLYSRTGAHERICSVLEPLSAIELRQECLRGLRHIDD